MGAGEPDDLVADAATTGIGTMRDKTRQPSPEYSTASRMAKAATDTIATVIRNAVPQRGTFDRRRPGRRSWRRWRPGYTRLVFMAEIGTWRVVMTLEVARPAIQTMPCRTRPMAVGAGEPDDLVADRRPPRESAQCATRLASLAPNTVRHPEWRRPRTDTIATVIRNAVPQRGCGVGCRRTFSTVSGWPAS